jgi:hypothetical protein
MAKNSRRGFRLGAVRTRSQLLSPVTRIWVKRDNTTGRFMGAKTSDGCYKGVRHEQ